MQADLPDEMFVEHTVTYTLEVHGRFVIIEHVPARVSLRTGERFFAPERVERLQKIVWEERTPNRLNQTAAYEFPSAVE